MKEAAQHFPSDEQVPSAPTPGEVPRRKPAQIGRHGADCRVPVELETTDPETGEVRTVHTAKRCGQKDCPDCGPWLRRCFAAHYTEQLEKKIARGKPEEDTWFLTLTPQNELAGSLGNKLEALSEIRTKYLEKLRYRTGGLSYLWVAETGERRRPHLHLLIHGDLSPGDLKESWMKAGGGMVNCAKRVGDHDHLVSAVWYISKEQFCDPERGEEGFPGHQTNGHSLDIEGYTSQGAKERREQHAREAVVEGLLEGDVGGRPVCDEKALRMYQRRALPEEVGSEVRVRGGGRASLLNWNENGAFIATPGGAKEVGPYEVFPSGVPLPRLYESAKHERFSAGQPMPEPDVEPAPIPGEEATFQLGDEGGTADQQAGEESPTCGIVEELRKVGSKVASAGPFPPPTGEATPEKPLQVSTFLLRWVRWATQLLYQT